MQDKPKKLPRIRDIEYSPNANPLIEPQQIELKRRRVSTGVKRDLVDAQTGEITHAATIHVVEERDDAEFVKVFAAGVKAIYDLTKTGYRVFQCILEEYQRTPMTGGYADTIYLIWFDGGLSGRDINMSEATFNRGLRELLSKGFISPRTPSVYWINPALFFKGDRVAFIREYRRKRVVDKLRDPNTVDLIDGLTDAERASQS